MPMLFDNLFLCTGTETGFFPDGALLVDGSKIVWSGARADLPADLALGATHRDLGGRIVVPGLVNTHAHGGMSAQRGCCDEGNLFEWAASLAPFTSVLTLEDNRIGCDLAVMEMVRNAVSLQTNSNLGTDPVATQAVAANARLATLGGGQFLLSRLDDSVSAELADEVRAFANNLEYIGMGQLAGASSQDPAQTSRLNDVQASAERITELCA